MSVRIRVKGIVQGVGFRPFVYLLAKEHGLRGWVLNDQNGVEIQLEGDETRIDAFLADLPRKAPPAARVDSIRHEPSQEENHSDFKIIESRQCQSITTRISPDLSLCGKCLEELQDAEDRHFQYPYINCTHCGPRYSIIRALPYDRQATTMANWPMCALCQAGYEDPSDRRFHAQPVACPECGPNFYLRMDNRVTARGMAAIEECAQLLSAGKIVAVKGIGGYHLALDAINKDDLNALRERKYGKEKPLEMMQANIELAESMVEL